MSASQGSRRYLGAVLEKPSFTTAGQARLAPLVRLPVCQELPALAVSLPQGRVAAEVSQHSRVLSLIAPPHCLSDLDRKLGAAPNDNNQQRRW